MQHPDYPDIDFKPAIARYDWDQTYDCLQFQYLPRGFNSFSKQFGLPAYETMLIDRFTPDNWGWAEKYSDYLYQLLKRFNYAPHNACDERVMKDEFDRPIIKMSDYSQWRGEWTPETSYQVGDCFSVNNRYFFVRNAFTSPEFWEDQMNGVNLEDPTSDLAFFDTYYSSYKEIDDTLNKFDVLRIGDDVYLKLVDGEAPSPVPERIGNTRFGNGQRIGDNNDKWYKMTRTIPKFTPKQRYNRNEPIKFNITKGTYLITCLLNDGYTQGLTDNIITTNKSHHQFIIDNDGIFDLNSVLKFITRDEEGDSYFCINSLRLFKKNNDTWQELTPSVNGNPNIFYHNIATNFNRIRQELIRYFDDISQEFWGVEESYFLPYYSYTDKYILNNFTEEPQNTLELSRNLNFSLPNVPSYVDSIYKKYAGDTLPLRYFLKNISSDITDKTTFQGNFRQDVIDLPPQGSSIYILNYPIRETILSPTIPYLPDISYTGGIANSQFPSIFNLQTSFKNITYNFYLIPQNITNNCYLARANNNKWQYQNTYNDINQQFIPVNIPEEEYYPRIWEIINNFQNDSNYSQSALESLANFPLLSEQSFDENNLEIITSNLEINYPSEVIEEQKTNFTAFGSYFFYTLSDSKGQRFGNVFVPSELDLFTARALGEQTFSPFTFTLPFRYGWQKLQLNERRFNGFNFTINPVVNFFEPKLNFIKKQRTFTTFQMEITHRFRETISSYYPNSELDRIEDKIETEFIRINIDKYNSYYTISLNESNYYFYQQEIFKIKQNYTGVDIKVINSNFTNTPFIYDTTMSFYEQSNRPIIEPRHSTINTYEQEIWTEQEIIEIRQWQQQNLLLTTEQWANQLKQRKQQLENDEDYGDMVDSVRIKEIHACLGAKDYAYYRDDNNQIKEIATPMAWRLEKLSEIWGLLYNPDGTVRSVRQRKRVPYNNQGQVTIPEGWGRGQFSVNKGDGQSHNPNDLTKQNGGTTDEDRLGIVYQNRCNKYENFDDDNPDNNVLKRGDIILCENMLQYIESYLEDLDKGLNWQEMGTGVLPSADSTGFCTYEGMGTLLAEVAYMISQLSSNIYETHNLSLMTFNNTIELFKAIGVPTGVSVMKIDTGEPDPQVEGETQKANMVMTRIADDAPSLTAQLYNLLNNLALIIGAFSELPEQEDEPEQ